MSHGHAFPGKLHHDRGGGSGGRRRPHFAADGRGGHAAGAGPANAKIGTKPIVRSGRTVRATKDGAAILVHAQSLLRGVKIFAAWPMRNNFPDS